MEKNNEKQEIMTMTAEAEKERIKTVTILLTRYSTLFSRFICGISKNHYSHAAISIDGNEELFYSFNCKGFVVEKPKKRKPRTQRAGSICIRMQVPESTYALIKEELDYFLEHRERYAFSRLGVALCVLHIPHKFKNRYFCSQFVAEILARAGAVELEKKESLYMPGQLLDRMKSVYSEKQIIVDGI
ncbi:MAG: hypothetical protein Q4C58_01180 [Eubacteriales bacterium]|nr:hypothetical protein [Eubacteriales bacterium]